jgi:two-component system sensor histidine kinase UhpB
MLDRATRSIMDVINEVRAISHSLVPPTLGDLGLVESVRELVATVALVQKLHVDLDATDFNETGLPENGKLMLYRIIQEALNNIIKHAHASTVHIYLARNRKTVLLQISDNGQGFDPGKARRGLGLNNIRNRAELFGGKVVLKAEPGAGCILTVSIPEM